MDGQSQTLEAAVAEYKRRYGIPPPPNFDNWYTFARLKGVQLIDEYDTVYKTLLPFWGVSPATIRARAREAIGYPDNMLMGLGIRDGQASVVTGGPDWLQQAAVGMIQNFVKWLPDMDLAFNTHDEPRVVVPHDDLSRLVRIALDENMPAAFQNPTPRNSFRAGRCCSRLHNYAVFADFGIDATDRDCIPRVVLRSRASSTKRDRISRAVDL